MSVSMKYISFEGPMHPEIVIFPGSRTHSAMMQLLHIKKEDMLGAGDINLEAIPPYCHGQSVSLNIMSRGQKDSHLLYQLAGFNFP